MEPQRQSDPDESSKLSANDPFSNLVVLQLKYNLSANYCVCIGLNAPCEVHWIKILVFSPGSLSELFEHGDIFNTSFIFHETDAKGVQYTLEKPQSRQKFCY